VSQRLAGKTRNDCDQFGGDDGLGDVLRIADELRLRLGIPIDRFVGAESRGRAAKTGGQLSVHERRLRF
jgi:hypothetical protein